MTKRGRYIWLGLFGLIGGFLSWGAWRESPGQDSDNQGGYAIVVLLFLILLFIYVPVIMRSTGAWLQHRVASDARPRGDA